MGKHMTVGAAEANRSFSKLLRAARSGVRVTITAYGKPVAELLPAAEDDVEQKRRAEAFKKLQAHWVATKPALIGSWNREDLYDRG